MPRRGSAAPNKCVKKKKKKNPGGDRMLTAANPMKGNIFTFLKSEAGQGEGGTALTRRGL